MAAKESGFTADEKAAVKQAAAERKRQKAGEDGAAAVRDAIAAMDARDQPVAQGLDDLVSEQFPELGRKTYYGFPAYTNAAGKVVFFYQFAAKFKTRYGHVFFNDVAHLDEGDLWPVAFAVQRWDAAVADRFAQQIRRALG